MSFNLHPTLTSPTPEKNTLTTVTGDTPDRLESDLKLFMDTIDTLPSIPPHYSSIQQSLNEYQARITALTSNVKPDAQHHKQAMRRLQCVFDCVLHDLNKSFNT